MPGMNGLETARQLLDIAPAVPVVMFTQHASPDLQKLAHEVGIRTVVSKMDAFSVAGIIEALLGSDDSSGSAPNLGLGPGSASKTETADGNGGSGTEM